MKLLAIETCFKSTSVCMYTGTDFDEIIQGQTNRHVNVLPSIAQSLFKKHSISVPDLDGVIVNHGPGAFTGLRVGIAFAKGLATPFNIPLYGVSTLECFVHDNSPQTIAVQGLKDYCYIQNFQNSKPCTDITHVHISEIDIKGKLITVGFHNASETKHYAQTPSARTLVERFIFQKPNLLREPLYVRPINAVVPQNMKTIL